eukprot:15605489-Heterocapsa_arctica.AAC.1
MEALKSKQVALEKEASTRASRDGASVQGSNLGGSAWNAPASGYGYGNNTKQEHSPKKVDIK